MIKTLLFGAGEGCRKFISNEKNKRNFLGVIDNDVKRKGELFETLLIISPKDINNFDYDEIVITTQWAEQVKNQLINDIGINKKRIFVPPKNILKKPQPFMDKKTWELANIILKTLLKEANKSNIELLVDFGTLLGLIRDNKIMEWDDDIDFALHMKDVNNIENWLLDAVERNIFPVSFTIEKRVDKNNCLVAFLLKFESSEYNSFSTSFSFRKDINGSSIHMPSLGLWHAPSKHFLAYDEIEWENISVKVPHQAKEYLSFLYGDWEIPKKFINMTDYENLGDVDFEEFKEIGFKSETIK